MRRKLADRAFDPADIDATLAALAREGLLSDARFVEGFVGSQARRGHGPVWIRAELEKRGLSAGEAAAALADAGVDFTALAREVRAKRFGPGFPGDYRERAKQLRFLQYRGFTAEQGRAALGVGADEDA